MTAPEKIDHPDDLAALWAFIDGGHDYSAPQLFAIVIDADRTVVPRVSLMYDHDFEGVPIDALLARFVEIYAHLLDDIGAGGSLAVMRARPGSSVMNSEDRRWCRLLHEHLQRAPFPTHPLYFATSAGRPRIVVPDDLIGAA